MAEKKGKGKTEEEKRGREVKGNGGKRGKRITKAYVIAVA